MQKFKDYSIGVVGLILTIVSAYAWYDFYKSDIVATVAFAFIIVPLFASMSIIGFLRVGGVK